MVILLRIIVSSAATRASASCVDVPLTACVHNSLIHKAVCSNHHLCQFVWKPKLEMVRVVSALPTSWRLTLSCGTQPRASQHPFLIGHMPSVSGVEKQMLPRDVTL